NSGMATITGGMPPSRCVSALSAVKSASLAGSTSTITTVAPLASSLRASLANAPTVRLSSTLPSMPNVERTRRSKSASRHCATTRVLAGSGFARANINCLERLLRRGLHQDRVVFHRRGTGAGDALHLVGAVALRCRRHPLAVIGDVAVTGVRRPRVDHMDDLVGGDRIAGREAHGIAPVEIHVGAGAEQRSRGKRQDRAAEAIS